MKIKIKPLVNDLILPEYKTDEALCLDVYLPQETNIYPNSLCACTEIPLGFAVELPKGYALKLHLRSSVGRDTRLSMANGVGIIDSDFRGEVKAYVRNAGQQIITFPKDIRLFQLELVAQPEKVEWEIAKTLKETKRGKSSGSTGK